MVSLASWMRHSKDVKEVDGGRRGQQSFEAYGFVAAGMPLVRFVRSASLDMASLPAKLF